jgi:integrase
MTPARKTIQTFGQKRRGDYVRVLLDVNRGRYEVVFDDSAGGKAKKTFADDKQGKKEALAWAEAFYDERRRQADASRAPAAPVKRTLREIWKLYTASPAFLKGIRQKSRDNYAPRWRKWEEYLGADFVADATTFHDVDGFITRAGEAGMAINQVRQVINVARIVYNWAASRDLIDVNKLGVYRWQTPKDAKVHEPGDYSTAELEAMLRTLDPTRHDQWRPWVAILVVAESGQRAQAIRNLQWADLDWAAGEIVWRGEFQKQGKELRRPITWGFYSALLVAQHWATVELRARPEHGARVRNASGQFEHDPEVPVVERRSPWVLFAARKYAEPYSYSSLHYQWRQAEDKAGIDHERYRAVHGGRRTVVGNVGEATGDRMLGLEYVGDTDPKMLKHYDKRSAERIRKAAEHVGGKQK